MIQNAQRRSNVLLIALVLLLLVQLIWLAHSVTRKGRWFRNLDGATPRGTFFDMSTGYWVWVTFGTGWPNGDAGSIDGNRHRLLGFQYWNGGSFARFIIVPAYWTIPPNLLPILWIVGKRWLARRAENRRWRKGCCPDCGFDLRATFEICPECGRPVPAMVRRRHYEMEMMSTPPPT